MWAKLLLNKEDWWVCVGLKYSRSWYGAEIQRPIWVKNPRRRVKAPSSPVSLTRKYAEIDTLQEQTDNQAFRMATYQVGHATGPALVLFHGESA